MIGYESLFGQSKVAQASCLSTDDFDRWST